MSNEKILISITNIILWMIVIVGTLGIIAGLLWFVDIFVVLIFKRLKIFPILYDFIWRRSRYYEDKK